ncbi:alpha/beta hydrolase [Chloroflexia bacterium SDU3-3]|nr:alpha/beta hydrolase [Chloroflexia bacterium SDU3-3]
MLLHKLHIEDHKLAALALNPDADGEPIILLHGINLSPSFWRTDDLFTRHGPCHALTLPGHFPGAFPPNMPESALDAASIARLLAATIRQLVGDRPVTVAGISTGGFAALALAAHEPQLVRRVVSISGFAEGGWTGMLGTYQAWLRDTPPHYRRFRILWQLSHLSQGFFRRFVWPTLVADRATFNRYPQLSTLISHIYADWVHQDMDMVAMYYRRMPDISIADMLPSIRAQTLVLAGDSDPTVPPEQSRLIARLVPGAELAMLEGAGHLLFAERPHMYDTIIEGWLQRTRDNS